MPRVRVLLAFALLLMLLPILGAPARTARAASGIGTAQTDFTRLTPANAMLFATFQPTAADQLPNLMTLEHAIMSQPGVTGLLPSAPGSSSQALAMLQLVSTGLRTMFDGEVGLTVLPVTTATTAGGVTVPRLHALIDAGLNPGVSLTQFSAALSLLGLTTSQPTTYRNVSISSIDLGTVLEMLGSGRARATVSQSSPISTTVYLASVGNSLVGATDLPTMQAAIDVSAGATPSISSNDDYQTTFGALPDSRLATVYMHVDFAAAAQLAQALHPGHSLKGRTGTVSDAFAVTAKPDGLLFTASPSIRTGSAVAPLALSPLQNSTAAILPQGTLFYAALNDPGTILQSLLSAAASVAQQSSFPIKPLDITKELDKLLGIDLSQAIFSWMHGEASIAVLPVGNGALGPSVPAANRLSLVITLKIADQATVDQTLQQIAAAFQALSSGPAGLQLVPTTGTNGSPERILAATPNGIGYAFDNGYLIVATALPNDLAAIQAAGAANNLSTDPVFKSALADAGPGPYGAVAYFNLSALRQSLEQVAQDAGVDLTRYNQRIRPFLTAFKSFSMVANQGTDGGGVAFLGIGS